MVVKQSAAAEVRRHCSDAASGFALFEALAPRTQAEAAQHNVAATGGGEQRDAHPVERSGSAHWHAVAHAFKLTSQVGAGSNVIVQSHLKQIRKAKVQQRFFLQNSHGTRHR